MAFSLAGDFGKLLKANASWLMSLVGIAASVGLFHLSRRRPPPVIELEATPLPDWPGWQIVTATIRNHAPASLVLERVTVPAWRSARVTDLSEHVTVRETRERSWLTGEIIHHSARVRRADIPATRGALSIDFTPITVAPDPAKRRRVTFFIPPGADGTPPRKARFTFTLRYADQGQKRKKITMHI